MTISFIPASKESHYSLKSLLKRWNELEPEICRSIHDSVYDRTAYVLKLETPCEQFWYELKETTNKTLEYAVIQSCVQGALSRHEMHWRLTYARGLSEASVIQAGQRHSASLVSASKALLWAYLNALEWKQSVSRKVLPLMVDKISD